MHLIPPTGQSAFPDLVASTWRIALDSSSRRFEHVAVRSGVPLVRVDVRGSGNSFITTAARTVLTPSMGDECFSVLVTTPHTTIPLGPISPLGPLGSVPPSSVNEEWAQWPPLGEKQMPCNPSAGRERTEREDNTGARHVARLLRSPPAWDQIPIVGIAWFACHGRPKGRVLVVRVRAVELWDVAGGTCVLRANLSAALEAVGSRLFGGCCSADGNEVCVWDNTRRREQGQGEGERQGEGEGEWRWTCWDRASNSFQPSHREHNTSRDDATETTERQGNVQGDGQKDGQGVVEGGWQGAQGGCIVMDGAGREWHARCSHSLGGITFDLPAPTPTPTTVESSSLCFTVVSPDTSLIRRVFYSPQAGILCAASHTTLFIFQFFFNRVPVKLEALLPVEEATW